MAVPDVHDKERPKLKRGLTVWKDEGNNYKLLDADNVFWGITAGDRNDQGLIIPRDILSLYEKFKDRLDKEVHDFRFSQDLSAIYIDPTDRCNARCPYCYIPAEIRKNGRSMTEDELSLILEKIKRYFTGKKRKPVIIFHASEPLLVKEVIFDAIRKYSKYFKFGLQTNATLMEEADVKFLKRYRVGVGISLDASLPSINDRLRIGEDGGGNFVKAVRAIEWFDGYEGLNIITTVTRLNVGDLSKLVKFLHYRKVPCVLLNPIRLTRKNSRSLKPEGGALTKHFIDAVDTAIKLSENTDHKIIVGNFANVILAIVAPVARRLMCDISPCGGGRCFFTITASGDMIPCGEFIGLKGFIGGNIFSAKGACPPDGRRGSASGGKTEIEQAMQSKPFKKIRARIVENISDCKSCLFRNICGAPCAAELYALGDINQRSVFCEFYKEIIKYAFKMIADKKEKYCLRTEGIKNLEYVYRR